MKQKLGSSSLKEDSWFYDSLLQEFLKPPKNSISEYSPDKQSWGEKRKKQKKKTFSNFY